MGKVKQNKHLNAQRAAADPMGSKLPLADEIESLKLAKTKSESNNPKKRQADDNDDDQVILIIETVFTYICIVKFI